MTITEMKERKQELGLTNEMIASASGVPLGTVQKIFSGVTKSPRKLTIDAITAVLQKNGPYNRISGETMPGYTKAVRETSAGYTASVHEASAEYNAVPKDTRYTIDDYYALPDDQRVELIDGVFYDMTAPAKIHQKILLRLVLLFQECIDSHEMPCELYISPCDVRLDRDDYTMVQPDLLIVCGEDDLKAIRFEGAPDLVVEILSKSTRSKDLVLKLYKYRMAGVREYWIVDPKFRTVTVHYFIEEDYRPHIYDFDSEIPVFISEGRCSIDFSRVLKAIAAYYEE